MSGLKLRRVKSGFARVHDESYFASAMKTSAPTSAFALLELLVVLAVMFLLLVLMTPRYYKQGNAQLYACLSHQKQIGLGFILFKDDNGGKFPWQLSATTNGTSELVNDGQASSEFKALEAYVKSYDVYVCPTDSGRTAPASYATFTNRNTSYFVNVDAATNNALLTGDRNLSADGRPVPPGQFAFNNSTAMNWTHELHPVKLFKDFGCLGFTDGRAQFVEGKELNAIFQGQVPSGSRLLVP